MYQHLIPDYPVMEVVSKYGLGYVILPTYSPLDMLLHTSLFVQPGTIIRQKEGFKGKFVEIPSF